MPDRVHFEPFVQLADVADDEALIAWGGFYFRHGDSPYGEWRIVDDEELAEVAGADRSGTIGASSEPFGDAVVEVERDGQIARAETSEANYAWVRGLEPDTEYRYRVLVDGEAWAEGERWEWSFERGTLVRAGRRYDNRFRTFPAAEEPAPLTFVAIGDFGVGLFDPGRDGARQLRLAGALERAIDSRGARLVLTTGDNVYIGPEGTPAGTGNEDDDWYASFYQPYRYVLNRVPIFPTVGNHDAGDTENSDDREQLADNLFLDVRFRRRCSRGARRSSPGSFTGCRSGRWWSSSASIPRSRTSSRSSTTLTTLHTPSGCAAPSVRGTAISDAGGSRSPTIPLLRWARTRPHQGDGRSPRARVRGCGGSPRAERPRAQLPALRRERHPLRDHGRRRQAARGPSHRS